MKLRFIYVLCVSLFSSGCGEDDFPVTLETTQVERLLTGGSAKTWQPDASSLFQECEEDNEYTFTMTDEEDEELDIYTQKNGELPCDPEEDDEITGSWAVTAAAGSNRLTIYTDDDTAVYNIVLITASILELQNLEEEQKLIFKHSL